MKKQKTKRIIIIVFSVLLIGAALGLILLQKDKAETAPPKEEEKKVIGMYGSTSSYIFYPIVEDIDFNDYPDYFGLDREIHFKFESETVTVDEEIAEDYGPELKILVDYINDAIAGDYESLNSLFSENYYEKYDEYYSFTPQMLYDIELELLGETEDGDISYFGFDVSYKIYRNNGTFRNDFGKNSSRKLYFRVKVENGVAVIDNVESYN